MGQENRGTEATVEGIAVPKTKKARLPRRLQNSVGLFEPKVHEPAEQPARENQPKDSNGVGRSGQASTGTESAPVGSEVRRRAGSVDVDSVPAKVRDRFVQVGRQFYFPDGAAAFKDHGSRLTTRSENTELIRSLIQIAQARGWAEIVVGGSQGFRRAAWEAGQLAGLSVRGHRPTEVEQARLVRRVGRQPGAGSEARSTEELANPAATVSPPQPAAAVSSEVATEANSPRSALANAAESKSTRYALIRGELLEHGQASYLHHPQEEMSYFVRLKTASGERTIWGKDLGRAFAEATTRPKVGDAIGLQPTGRDRVTVQARDRDEEGRLVRERPLGTHRNRWIVERAEFFEARAGAARTLRDTSISPAMGVERNPDLVDAYLHVQAARELARQRIFRPQDQEKFVSLVREALAAATARGERVPPVQLRPAAALVDVLERNRQAKLEATR